MILFAPPTKTDLGEPYLKLQVGRQNQIALPMKYAQEVLAIPTQRLKEYNVAVIRVENIPLGLVVQKIKGVTKINPEKIQSPIGTVSSSLSPYLSGCILDTNDLILILDPTTIVS